MTRRPFPPKNIHPFEILEYEELVAIYNYIINSRPPIQFTQIGRIIDESILYVKRRYKRMYEIGYRFRVSIDEKKLGLSTLHLFLKSPYIPDPDYHVKGLNESFKWLLKWSGNMSFPQNRGLLMFYVPFSDEIVGELSTELFRSLPVEKAFETDVTLGNKPSLDYIKRIDGRKFVTDWERLSNEMLEAYRNGVTPRHYKEALKPREPIGIDLIDVLIISAFQVDALLTLREVAKMIKKPVGKLRRHLNSHLLKPEIITGVRLKDFVARTPETLYFVVIGRSEPYEVSLFMEYMRRTFNFASGAYNSITGEFVFIMALTSQDYLLFTRYMSKPYLMLLRNAEAFNLDRSSVHSYTLPFLAFSREERFWDADINVIQLMKEKLQDLLAQGSVGG